MERQIIGLFCFIYSALVYGQTVSITVDELTSHHLRTLSEKQRSHFDSILQSRVKTKLLERIDELKYDYAFIQETFCEYNQLTGTSERYFNEGDSIPNQIYFDGEQADPKKVYDNFYGWYTKNVTCQFTFKPLFERYSKFQPTQELAYDKRQVWQHGCVRWKNDEEDFEKRRTAELKETWQINTMVDKKSNKILVSVQYAPVKPKFETYSYNAVWDW